MPWTLTTTGLTGLQQRYALAAQTTGQTIARVMTHRLAEAVTEARQMYRSASATTSESTAVRTGALRAALGSEVRVEGTTVRGLFGYLRGSVPYASVHEGWPEGRTSTTIRPTHGQYLTIPLAAAKTAAGVARGEARSFPNTFIARSKRGSLLIFQRQGKQVVPLFVLVKQVIVPARPALFPTMARTIPRIVEDLTQGLTQQLG